MESATLTRPRPGAGWLARLQAVSASTWAKLGLGVLVLVALLGFLLYPTYPNYDSYYYLLWGRDLLHLHAPAFRVYRAPTEHPLALALGALLSLAGRSGDRLWVAMIIASYVALVAGLYRLGRLAFTPLVGAVAAILLLSRFQFAFLAARGYIDIPYLALVVWAAVLELERRRRGWPVLLLLAGAGLLRPEAWMLTGLYLVWCAWPEPWPARIRLAALAAVGPALWLGMDLAITGDPLYSLHSTSGLAADLGRATGVGNIPLATVQFLERLDRAPVVVAAVVGTVLALGLAPRRCVVPGALLAIGVATFFMVGIAGLSIIDRYLLVPSLMVMVFAAVGIAGWTMLVPGALRRAWAAAALLLVVYATGYTVLKVSLDNIDTELAFRRDSHRALTALLADTAVRRALACGPVSVPNHKLIPELRWLMDRGPDEIVARSDARARADRGDQALERRLASGIAIYPTGDAVFRQAIVDPGDAAIDQVPAASFDRVATTQYYAAYAHC